ncbi:TIGR02269 family lipoprotein [Hyalangium gracile]|uniref:TIGR02269 family lipoprotein n=1 Tax=Hyalangium gracile TaxID=394092 RepID=UPI001CCDC6CA|nr:TIGR02269 family lipoprotein [Hyalangium gracile]
MATMGLRLALIMLVALAWMTGCATSSVGGRQSTPQGGAASADPCQDGGCFGFSKQQDDLQLLLQAASVEEDSRLEVEEELEPDEARALWERLARTRTTLRNFGPRRSLVFLLRQVLSRDEDVPYSELVRRVGAFQSLVVMRPDGYLVSALSGKSIQRMGRLELRDGRLMAGNFEVGAFYRDKGGVFYPVDESLNLSGGLVGELGLERDWFNAALDGSEDALVELGHALARFVTSPVRSLQGLQQLPTAVAGLIASSPDYFARYSALPLQEQIREASRLSTHLLMLYGSAAGTTARIGTTTAELPVLSLSAEGALLIEQVALPMGTTTAALGTSVGAVYVLMGSGQAPPEGSPGQVSGAARTAGSGFRAFTESNFRENLARLTGQLPDGAHAHHVFPQKLARKFEQAGINVHDPRFGAWWERSSHLKNAAEYTKRWESFFDRERTFEQILQHGRELGGEFGFQVHF